MRDLARLLDTFNTRIGRAAAWATLVLLLLQFGVVVARYVFGVGSVWAQEAVIYLFGAIMTLTAGWALAVEAHVRVDLLYRGASPRAKAVIDLIGVIGFLVPVCAIVLWTAAPYVRDSWAILERSRETSGIPAVFLLKSMILVFATLVLIAGIALALRSLALLRDPAMPDGASASPPSPGP